MFIDPADFVMKVTCTTCGGSGRITNERCSLYQKHTSNRYVHFLSVF
jgi:DnaJ-class molecular chaperone